MAKQACGEEDVVVLHTTPQVAGQAWTTGLCDCCVDKRGCAEATFCGTCQLTRQFNFVLYGRNDCDPLMWSATLCMNVLAGHFPAATVAQAWFVRAQLRQRYGISGDVMSDIVTALFCGHCAIAQQYREMSIRGEWTSGFCVNEPFTMAHTPVPANTIA